MQSLINDVKSLDEYGKYGLLVERDKVIALIKQHERPVDEEQLGHLASKLINVVQGHIASGATPLRTAICRVLRPYLKQQQPVSAEVVERVAIALYNVHREQDFRLLWEEIPNEYLRNLWRDLAKAALAAMQANITAKE